MALASTSILWTLAASKTFPGGAYRVIHLPGQTRELRLQKVDAEEVTPLPVLTRLARQPLEGGTSETLVFDKVGAKHILSEVWLPDEDGFLLEATKEDHSHSIVEVHDGR